MEAVPTAGDTLERVINEDNLGEVGGLVAEDAMKDVHEDVQKHVKRVSRSHKTRSSILSQLWKSRTAQALHLPLSMRSRQPCAQLHPVQLPRLAPRPRGCIRQNRESTLLSKLVSRGIGACFEVGMGVSRSQGWRSMHLGLGRPRLGDQREGQDFDTLREFLSL